MLRKTSLAASVITRSGQDEHQLQEIPRTESPTGIDVNELPNKYQDYTLPPAVQTAMSSWIKNANGLALIMTLFAAVQIVVIQILPPLVDPDGVSKNSTLWKTTRWFVYAGILFHLGGAGSSMATILQAAHLPSRGLTMALEQPDSLPHRVYQKGANIPVELLVDIAEYDLLCSWGLQRRWNACAVHMVFCFYLGFICSFISLTLWVWAAEVELGIAPAALLLPLAVVAGSTAHYVLIG
ncbi:hypothetical protein PIIN_08886 [Serendipita indica DSM 11827]|uniref:Uncharacterized protein n=1 Tax=Serendipita indica (strain DSM 11827) TaxID=1109443 RepID=G4TUC3_SERID|nr:hypothetical protein PIIN_08886 [Serendipita indica DSM 11827]